MDQRLWAGDVLIPGLPLFEILSAYDHAPGDEAGSGNLTSPESSAALVANAFGFFLKRPKDLPAFGGLDKCGWPARAVELERCLRFPWTGGRHPWLDVVVETRTHLIAIESKRFEPYRNEAPGSFSSAYKRPVWGSRMKPFERLRDELSAAEGTSLFRYLDAVQLVKHAFGLRTQASELGKRAVLLYLYAEPARWPKTQRPITAAQRKAHADEVRQFADRVAGAEVAFASCTYADFLAALCASKTPEVRAHAKALKGRFAV